MVSSSESWFSSITSSFGTVHFLSVSSNASAFHHRFFLSSWSTKIAHHHGPGLPILLPSVYIFIIMLVLQTLSKYVHLCYASTNHKTHLTTPHLHRTPQSSSMDCKDTVPKCKRKNKNIPIHSSHGRIGYWNYFSVHTCYTTTNISVHNK